jgi:hypothetical protein
VALELAVTLMPSENASPAFQSGMYRGKPAVLDKPVTLCDQRCAGMAL